MAARDFEDILQVKVFMYHFKRDSNIFCGSALCLQLKDYFLSHTTQWYWTYSGQYQPGTPWLSSDYTQKQLGRRY
jgi:hypothetical protein